MMLDLLLHLLALSVAVFLVAEFLPGVKVRSFGTAVLVAVIFAVLKAVLGTILTFLLFPLVFLTLGLFSFVISAVLLWITSRAVEGFEVDGIGPTLLAALLISVLDVVFSWVLRLI